MNLYMSFYLAIGLVNLSLHNISYTTVDMYSRLNLELRLRYTLFFQGYDYNSMTTAASLFG